MKPPKCQSYCRHKNGHFPAAIVWPANTYTKDSQYHWKVCATCNGMIGSTQGAHTGGEATCRTQAKCAVCGAYYGGFADHVWSNTWDHYDDKGHYHGCKTPGCDQRGPVAAHTPDRAEATETQDKKCKDCGYVLEPAKKHIHKAQKRLRSCPQSVKSPQNRL